MLAYYYPQGKQRCIDGVGQLQNLGGAPQATERFSERVCHDGEGSLCLRKRTTINWASRIKAHDDTLTHTGHKIDPKRMEVCMAHTHTHTHTHTYTHTDSLPHTHTYSHICLVNLSVTMLCDVLYYDDDFENIISII